MFEHETFNLRWSIRWGHTCLDCDYAQDVGNLHVIDYRLWLAELPIRRPGCEAPRSLRFTDNWTRP